MNKDKSALVKAVEKKKAMSAADFDVKRLIFPAGKGYEIVRMKTIINIEINKNHLTIHRDGLGPVTVLCTMMDLKKLLPDNYFLSVHESYVVGILHVARYIWKREGAGAVIMSDGREIGVAPLCRDEVIRVLHVDGLFVPAKVVVKGKGEKE
ncbi:MAG: LytTR family transcriptional regulator DNA-binding domain-containing protein [Bacteroidota bacterium]